MSTRGKSPNTKSYPQAASETSDLFSRLEPQITPDILKSRYLHGVPNVDGYSNDELKQEIWLATNEVELMLNMPIFPIEVTERKPYDYSHYHAYFYFKCERRPVQSLVSANIVSSEGTVVWKTPTQWIDVGHLKTKGQINFLPLLTTISGSQQISAGDATGNSIFLQAMGGARWIPAFWELKTIVGFGDKEGNLPVIINDIIGMTAAIAMLSALQNTYIYGSQSLSQDGISQSSSTTQGQPFKVRIQMLTERRERMIAQIKMVFGTKFVLGNV